MTGVADNEWLSRFVLFSRWVRGSGPDKTVKPDAFIPHPYPDLSVTRRKNLSEQELWRVGQGIADLRPATLYGRADIQASEVRRWSLDVEPRPVANNPNHATVIGWPTDKPAQKIVALKLAAEASFIPKPLPGQG